MQVSRKILQVNAGFSRKPCGISVSFCNCGTQKRNYQVIVSRWKLGTKMFGMFASDWNIKRGTWASDTPKFRSSYRVRCPPRSLIVVPSGHQTWLENPL